jgi:tetratricopeptide (TPR) repeat protein
LSSYLFSVVLCEDFNTALKVVTEKAQKAPKDDQYYHTFEAATLAYLLDKNYVELFNKCIKQCEATFKEDKVFFQNSAKEFLSLKSQSKDDQIEFLEFQLEQYQKNENQELTIIIANIINKIESSDFAIMALGSVFDRNLFLEKTIENLDKIRDRKKINDKIISDYQINYNYGRIYFVNKKFAQALSYFKKNFILKQDDAYTNWLIGKCELSLGNREDAKKYFTINKKLVSTDKEQLKYINASIWELRKLEE